MLFRSALFNDFEEVNSVSVPTLASSWLEPDPSSPSTSAAWQCDGPTSSPGDEVSGPVTPSSEEPQCPRCSRGMEVRRNRQSGAQFYGCSGFPGCRETYSLEVGRAFARHRRAE